MPMVARRRGGAAASVTFQREAIETCYILDNFSTEATFFADTDVIKAGLQSNGEEVRAFIRFDGITIPAGSSITSAYIDYEPEGYEGSAPPLDMAWNGVRADPSSATWPTSGTTFEAFPRELGGSNGVFEESNFSLGVQRQSPNLAAIVQSLVNRYSGYSNQEMWFLLAEDYNGPTADARLVYHGAGSGSDFKPVLTVTYSPP